MAKLNNYHISCAHVVNQRLPQAFRQKVLTLPVRLEIEDWSAFDQALDKLL